MAKVPLTRQTFLLWQPGAPQISPWAMYPFSDYGSTSPGIFDRMTPFSHHALPVAMRRKKTRSRGGRVAFYIYIHPEHIRELPLDTNPTTQHQFSETGIHRSHVLGSCLSSGLSTSTAHLGCSLLTAHFGRTADAAL